MRYILTKLIRRRSKNMEEEKIVYKNIYTKTHKIWCLFIRNLKSIVLLAYAFHINVKSIKCISVCRVDCNNVIFSSYTIIHGWQGRVERPITINYELVLMSTERKLYDGDEAGRRCVGQRNKLPAIEFPTQVHLFGFFQ